MYVLGIHDGHNASVILLKDGRIMAGVQEERPRGVKNALGMPYAAIQDVLSQFSLKPADIDWVALSGLHNGEYLDISQSVKPSEIILKWHQAAYEQNSINLKAIAQRFVPKFIYEYLKGDKVRQRRLDILTSLGFACERVQMVEHHTAHAAAAYYGWGKLDEPILILTNDGMGDEICATISIGQGGHFERLYSTPYEDSVAELYALTTFLMGMVPLEHEYKLMGMAPYAPSSRAEQIYTKLADLIEFDDNGGLTWHRKKGVPAFSSAYRYLEKVYSRQRFDCICRGLQKFVEEFLTQWLRNAIAYTGIHKIALSGGIFMNVKANKLIMEMDEVEDMFVFPSCGDETNAAGAAYWVYAAERRKSGQAIDIEPISTLYWGKDFSSDQIDRVISKFVFTNSVHVVTPQDIERRVAELIANGQVVARFSGRMEFGARALGNRSILANPADPRIIKTINEMIKKRDFWMPFAPSVNVERVNDYMIKPMDVSAPYMILSFDSVLEKIPVFAAAVHPYDSTARPQEVMKSHNLSYHRLIQYYGEITGEEIILNTSFNLHGFPIVYTPQQALTTFDNSGLQHLAIGPFLVSKRNGC
jgi:carbamoyltransferase